MYGSCFLQKVVLLGLLLATESSRVSRDRVRRSQNKDGANATSVDASSGGMQSQSQVNESVSVDPVLRARLVRFYQQYNPAKISEVDHLLTKYQGKEDMLFKVMVQKYGPEPQMNGGYPGNQANQHGNQYNQGQNGNQYNQYNQGQNANQYNQQQNQNAGQYNQGQNNQYNQGQNNQYNQNGQQRPPWVPNQPHGTYQVNQPYPNQQPNYPNQPNQPYPNQQPNYPNQARYPNGPNQPYVQPVVVQPVVVQPGYNGGYQDQRNLLNPRHGPNPVHQKMKVKNGGGHAKYGKNKYGHGGGHYKNKGYKGYKGFKFGFKGFKGGYKGGYKGGFKGGFKGFKIFD